MQPDKIEGRLRVYHWDDLGYTVRVAPQLDGSINFDSYKIYDKKPSNSDLDVGIDRHERYYRKIGTKNVLVNLTDIRDAEMFVGGDIAVDGSIFIYFAKTLHADLDRTFEGSEDLANVGHLLNRIYATAKGLL